MDKHIDVFVGIDVVKSRNAIAIADSERGGEVRYFGEGAAAPDAMRRVADRDANQPRQWSPRIADGRAPAARPRALKTPLTVHLVRNTMDFVSWKHRKPLAGALEGIYPAVDAKGVPRRRLPPSRPANGAPALSCHRPEPAP